MRIAITGYQFEELQKQQKRSLLEQKLYLRCNFANQFATDPFNIRVNSTSSNKRTLTLGSEIDVKGINSDGKDSGIRGIRSADNKEQDDEKESLLSQNSGDLTIGNRGDDDVNIAIDYDGDKRRLEIQNGYNYNLEFIGEILALVEAKPIYPKLFKLRLNSILAKAIASLIVSILAAALRIFG